MAASIRSDCRGAELEPELRALAEERAGALGELAPLLPRHQPEHAGACRAVGCRMPVSILIEVDFPAPLGPMKASRSPRDTESVRSWTASTAPEDPRNRLVIPAASMAGPPRCSSGIPIARSSSRDRARDHRIPARHGTAAVVGPCSTGRTRAPRGVYPPPSACRPRIRGRPVTRFSARHFSRSFSSRRPVTTTPTTPSSTRTSTCHSEPRPTDPVVSSRSSCAEW